MRQLRLALVHAAMDNPNTSRNFRRELDASLIEHDVTRRPPPEQFDIDGVVITGSRASVYWDEEWIDWTKSWVREAINRQLPILGVCWGHQLLAEVLGGEVTNMGEYEVGYSEIERTGEESPLFEGIDERFLSFTSHQDAVEALPTGATPLARNEYSNHGFQLGQLFGIQFHPEYDQQSARDLIEEKDLEPDRRERLLSEVTDENHRRSRGSARVFDNFVDIVRRRQREEKPA